MSEKQIVAVGVVEENAIVVQVGDASCVQCHQPYVIGHVCDTLFQYYESNSIEMIEGAASCIYCHAPYFDGHVCYEPSMFKYLPDILNYTDKEVMEILEEEFPPREVTND